MGLKTICPYWIGTINEKGGEHSGKKICGLYPFGLMACDGKVAYLGTEDVPFDSLKYEFECQERGNRFNVNDNAFNRDAHSFIGCVGEHFLAKKAAKEFEAGYKFPTHVPLDVMKEDLKKLITELDGEKAVEWNQDIRSAIRKEIRNYEGW